MEISKIIKLHGHTVKDVAEALGVNRVTLSQTITNNPTVSTLRRIADVIGCDVADFFADERRDAAASSAAAEQQAAQPPHVCPHCGKPLRVRID